MAVLPVVQCLGPTPTLTRACSYELLILFRGFQFFQQLSQVSVSNTTYWGHLWCHYCWKTKWCQQIEF